MHAETSAIVSRLRPRRVLLIAIFKHSQRFLCKIG